jgi:hypothetical protein
MSNEIALNYEHLCARFPGLPETALINKVRPLFGGLDAWIAAGYAVVSAPEK